MLAFCGADPFAGLLLCNLIPPIFSVFLHSASTIGFDVIKYVSEVWVLLHGCQSFLVSWVGSCLCLRTKHRLSHSRCVQNSLCFQVRLLRCLWVLLQILYDVLRCLWVDAGRQGNRYLIGNVTYRILKSRSQCMQSWLWFHTKHKLIALALSVYLSSVGQ